MKATKEQHWRGIIREWERSRLTQRDFYTAERIAYSTFQYWNKRLKGTSERPRFVAMAMEAKPRHEISISFESGVRMIVSDNVAQNPVNPANQSGFWLPLYAVQYIMLNSLPHQLLQPFCDENKVAIFSR